MRILYWNINNFSLLKIDVPGADPRYSDAHLAASRLDYMLTIMRGPVGGIPDVIVIVEVFSRTQDVEAEGTQLNPNNNSGLAVQTLLNSIRADPVLGAATNWCIVPPLNLGGLGYREAVAVFYNATTLQFTGPNLFWQLYGPPGPVGQSQPVNPATAANMVAYNQPWTAAMPMLGRTTNFPGVAAAIPENQLAGEWQYYQPGTIRPVPSPAYPVIPPNRLQFPLNGNRGPFATRFLEIATGRTIHLFSVHTSPATALAAVANLALVGEIITPPAGNEVKVLLGDFNVDTFADFGAYGPLINPPGIYTMQLDPRGALNPGPLESARKPYCMTHLLPVDKATPFNNLTVATDPQHNFYPRAGYMGVAFPGILDVGAIDNFLTAHGPGAGAAANITVVNTLAGTPYNAFPAPPNVTGELINGLPFASTFPVVMPPLPPPLPPHPPLNNMISAVPPASAVVGGISPADPNHAYYLGLFRIWHFMGRIYSTSDHLPLMIDV